MPWPSLLTLDLFNTYLGCIQLFIEFKTYNINEWIFEGKFERRGKYNVNFKFRHSSYHQAECRATQYVHMLPESRRLSPSASHLIAPLACWRWRSWAIAIYLELLVALLQLQLQLRFLSAEVSVTNLESKKLFPYISKYQYKKNLPIPLFYKQTEVGCIRAELMNGRSHSYVYNVRSITWPEVTMGHFHRDCTRKLWESYCGGIDQEK